MFDVGFTELVLLFVIGLLILGPERLPRVASQIGRWVGRARRTANQLRHQLEREIALDDMAKAEARGTRHSAGARGADRAAQDSASDEAGEAAAGYETASGTQGTHDANTETPADGAAPSASAAAGSDSDDKPAPGR